MKCTIFINENHEEEVLIYAHKRTELTDAIEQLVAENGIELVGYNDREGVKINLSEVFLFSVEKFSHFCYTIMRVGFVNHMQFIF